VNRRGFFAALLSAPALVLVPTPAQAVKPHRAREWKARLNAMRKRLFDIAYERKDPLDPVSMAVMDVHEGDGILMAQIRAESEPDPKEREHYRNMLTWPYEPPSVRWPKNLNTKAD
jgi:hypothetical protein